VEELRKRQLRNFAAILMLSRGVPMLVAGDEVRRTQGGNNNAYCQDNQTSWFDWTLVEQNRDLFRFWKHMIDFRKRHASLRRPTFFSAAVNERGMPEVVWHGTKLNSPGWNDPDGRALGITLAGFRGEEDIHIMLNMYWEALHFELPPVAGRVWFRAVDTSLTSPLDIAEPGSEAPIAGSTYPVGQRSVVVLISRTAKADSDLFRSLAMAESVPIRR
jgi:glycogen operon protein